MFNSKRKKTTTSAKRSRFRPSLEVLENRIALSHNGNHGGGGPPGGGGGGGGGDPGGDEPALFQFDSAFSLGDAATFDNASAVAVDDVGDVYLAGIFGGTVDFDLEAGTHNLTSVGERDAFVAKYQQNGDGTYNLLWATRAGGAFQDFVNSIALDSNGDVLVSGGFFTRADFGAFTLTSSPSLFITSYGGSAFDDGETLTIADDSGAGTFEFDDDGTVGPGNGAIVFSTTDSPQQMATAIAGAINNSSTLNVTAAIDPDGTGQLVDLQGATDASFVNLGSFVGVWIEREDAFVARIDGSTGNFEWATALAGGLGDTALDLAVDSAGNAHVTGQFTGKVDFGPNALRSTISLWATSGTSARDGETFTVDDGTSVVTFELERQEIGDGVASGNVEIVFDDSFSQTDLADAIVQAVNQHTSATAARAWIYAYISDAVSVTHAPLDPSDISLRLQIRPNAYLAEIDGADGTIISAEGMPGDGLDMRGQGIAVDDSAVYVAAQSATRTSELPEGMIVWKKSRVGGASWFHSYVDQGFLPINDIAVDSAGDVVVVGLFARTVDFDPSSGTLELTSKRTGRSYNIQNYVVKFNSTGGAVWAQALGGRSSWDYGSGLVIDASNNIYVADSIEEEVDFDPGKGKLLLGTEGIQTAFVVKLDGSGNFLGAAELAGDTNTSPWGMTLDGNNSVYVSGRFEGTTDFDPTAGEHLLTSAGNHDAFYVKLTQPATSSLTAADIGNNANAEILSVEQVEQLLAEAIARWESSGADSSVLSTTQVTITDLPNATLGMASGNTIWLDSNAAGWGWFVDATPWEDSEFSTPGDQGEMNRMDLLTVIAHELGHLLGYEHEADGVMAEMLPAGTRLTLLDAAFQDADWLAALDVFFAATSLSMRRW